MSVSESQRRDIYNRLESTIGDEAANNLMRLLPYEPADQLATRSDMAAQTGMLRGEMGELRSELKGEMGKLRTELKGEMGELRTELKDEMGELRTEMGELRSELTGEMGELRSELTGEMGQLRSEFRSELATQGAVAKSDNADLKVTMQRWMSGAVAANTIAIITTLIT